MLIFALKSDETDVYLLPGGFDSSRELVLDSKEILGILPEKVFICDEHVLFMCDDRLDKLDDQVLEDFFAPAVAGKDLVCRWVLKNNHIYPRDRFRTSS